MTCFGTRRMYPICAMLHSDVGRTSGGGNGGAFDFYNLKRRLDENNNYVFDYRALDSFQTAPSSPNPLIQNCPLRTGRDGLIGTAAA